MLTVRLRWQIPIMGLEKRKLAAKNFIIKSKDMKINGKQ